MRILALDTGPTAIGGALIDIERNAIRSCLVRVFPEGVDRDQQGGEQSKSQSRRDARGMRRQIRRRALRKRLIRRELQNIGLLPKDSAELTKLFADKRSNPYDLRAVALQRRLEEPELGRVFYHLVTRRGFLSNRKTDKARDTQGMLQEIGELNTTLAKRGEVLGHYLSQLHTQFDHRTSRDQDRVRHRHTQRSMYEAEFDAIWKKQREFYPDLLTDSLKYGVVGKQEFPTVPKSRRDGLTPLQLYGVYGLIFFQRKMYWPKSVIGQCDLTDECEPEKRCKRKRCHRADRASQEFRILQEVNNLKVLDSRGERWLDDEERQKIFNALMATKMQTFDALRKKLSFLDDMTFNLERGGRNKLKGHETDAAMSSNKGVGKRWRKLPDDAKDRIVDICVYETQEDIALHKLVDECGLTPEEAERASRLNLPDGYMNFCREAIQRLVPHLRRGLHLMADDARNSALHAAGYLRPDQRAINVQEFLPPPPDLPNPIVRQAVIEVRKVVNAVIREYGKPDAIHIELAREAKKSAEERREIRLDNLMRERRREQFAERLADEYGIKPTRANINRYVLWDEQGGDCIYCGEKISQVQLFSGDVDVDHILPRWRSLDDSMTNKVICHRRCNNEKKDRTAREWLETTDRPRYEKMLQIARRLDYRKRQKLQQLDIDLDDFVQRQLRDTTYIARCVKEYLECLGLPVVCPRGGMTKDLRHWWGLNNILDPEKLGRKNRADHRHHAIDAIVVALTDHSRLHALANSRGDNMPPPWPGFLNDARMAVLGINVSHRAQRKTSGALHEATIYGPTQKIDENVSDGETQPRPWAKGWVEDRKTFVRRKEVTKIKNAKHLEKVRDAAIRESLEEHLRKLGVDPYGSKQYPTDSFKGDNRPHMESGVPIKRVRMLEESETFRRVSNRRKTQFVKPGNNHHIIYWAEGEGENEKWSAEVIPMWDAANRVRMGRQPIDRRPPKGKRFVISLSNGEMFQLIGEKDQVLLCVVRKMDQRSKRVYYKLHTDARETEEVDKDNLYLSPKQMQLRGAKKVTVDPLGEIRWAND
ncbi:MAG: type II CRISPR RNA-guided endonuclease Cas9 [Pirellulales bacterium]|nr:type II CRISPR RNA-guided endonuclease Cas9 [Pirellulales bacterium]